MNLIALLLTLMLAGCVTKPPGFVKWTETGYALITPEARANYNALIERYGNRFNPPLAKDHGITPYSFEPPPGYHYRKFEQMNHWQQKETHEH